MPHGVDEDDVVRASVPVAWEGGSLAATTSARKKILANDTTTTVTFTAVGAAMRLGLNNVLTTKQYIYLPAGTSYTAVMDSINDFKYRTVVGTGTLYWNAFRGVA